MTYFYEHANGQVIRKPNIVVDSAGGPDQYFDSQFVKRWWKTEVYKIQKPLFSNDPGALDLYYFYNKDKSSVFQIESPELDNIWPEGEVKIYAECRIVDGNICIEEQAVDPGW